jgi:hypothetical protein
MTALSDAIAFVIHTIRGGSSAAGDAEMAVGG